MKNNLKEIKFYEKLSYWFFIIWLIMLFYHQYKFGFDSSNFFINLAGMIGAAILPFALGNIFAGIMSIFFKKFSFTMVWLGAICVLYMSIMGSMQ